MTILTAASENSDFLTIHSVFSSWRRAVANGSRVHKFCRENFLSHQNLQQIEELRQQFMGCVSALAICAKLTFVVDISLTPVSYKLTEPSLAILAGM
jgi:hypothetical protein